jgi:acetyl esterase/lipase
MESVLFLTKEVELPRKSKRPRGRGRFPFAAAAAAAAAAMFATACSPLATFGALVPKDAGVEVVARNVPYGADARQRVDVYRPNRLGPQPLPIIVLFYGGSWNSGSKSGYAFVARALASKGFVVAIPDYRLVPKVRYPAFLQDGAAATRWIAANAAKLGGDPDRIVIAGHSAGAYNGAMLAYDPRWLQSDQLRIRGFIGLAGPYDFLPFNGPVAREAFLGTADLKSTQPVSFVRRGAPPAFLATGLKDNLVLPQNSDALAARLELVGSSVVRKSYPHVGHVGVLAAIARPFRVRASVLNDMSAFATAATR